MTATFPTAADPQAVPADRTAVDRTLVADLRRYLTERLPGHMVPTVIVTLEALPLTPNRKVDAAALPDPPDDAYTPRSEPVVDPPSDAGEEAVAAIWREVLGRDDIGACDNFFRTGGNSFAVMRVLSQIRSRLDARISVHEFFEEPTIRALARRVRAGCDG
jgi:myxalamid-type nonribosomal peptide synthetase MxaA